MPVANSTLKSNTKNDRPHRINGTTQTNRLRALSSYLVPTLGKVQQHAQTRIQLVIASIISCVYYLQHFRYAVRHRFLGAQHRVASQLVLEFAALVPVDPAEHLRIVARRTAERDAMRPVLGQAVLPRGRLQAGRTQADAHRDVRLVVLRVVAPQRGERFFHAAFA